MLYKEILPRGLALESDQIEASTIIWILNHLNTDNILQQNCAKGFGRVVHHARQRVFIFGDLLVVSS